VAAENIQSATDSSQGYTVPPQRPAAVEPVWENDLLTLPNKRAKTDLTGRKFPAALRSLGAEVRALASDLVGEANIDRRFISLLNELAARIPQTSPSQDELFRVGHFESVLVAYAKTVNEQWPEILAARYHALALQFDRTMRQSPSWREFKRNASKETLTAQQVALAVSLAKETATALREAEAKEFVDESLPQATERLAAALDVTDKTSAEPVPEDVIEAGRELLAVDLIESVNNILKPIAEAALKIGADAGKGYGTGFGKGFIRAAKKQGPKDGEKAFKWLRRAALGGGATAVGLSVGLAPLIQKFPQAFGWLLRLLHL
jgi:hypothetical protein